MPRPSRHDQERRIRQLRRQLMLPDEDLYAALEHELDAHERLLRYLLTIDSEPASTFARQLITDGIELPPPDSFTEQSVAPKLWQVIHGLARRHAFLHCTNHLSDLDLYRLLWEVILNDPTHELDDSLGDCACHIDLVGDGSEAAQQLHLRYYASELDRSLWAAEFPDDPMPPREAPPYDRDRHLPQWHPTDQEPPINDQEIPF